MRYRNFSVMRQWAELDEFGNSSYLSYRLYGSTWSLGHQGVSGSRKSTTGARCARRSIEHLDEDGAVVNERFRDISQVVQKLQVGSCLVVPVGLLGQVQKQVAVPAPVDIDQHATACSIAG